MTRKILIIITIFLCFGCSTTQNRNYTSQPAQNIQNSINEQDRSIETIQEQNNAIQDRVNDIKDRTKEIRKETITDTTKEKLDDIDGFASRIDTRSKTIENQINDIQKESNNIRNNLSSVQKQEDKINDLENGGIDARNNLYELIRYMFALGGLIVVGGIALAFFNPKLGIYLAGFGLLITTVATAGTFYLKWLALVGFVLIGIGLVITLGFLVYSFWKAKIYRQSHESNVELVEKIKGDLLPEEKEKFFGDNGIASQIQPETVKKEIKKLRSKNENI